MSMSPNCRYAHASAKHPLLGLGQTDHRAQRLHVASSLLHRVDGPAWLVTARNAVARLHHHRYISGTSRRRWTSRTVKIWYRRDDLFSAITRTRFSWISHVCSPKGIKRVVVNPDCHDLSYIESAGILALCAFTRFRLVEICSSAR